MDTLQIKAIIAGVFFGIWPLLMNRSGLNGNLGSFMFTVVVLICVLPFSVTKLGEISSAHWMFAVSAGVAGAIGLLCFNDVLAKATLQDVGLLFVLMTITQVIIPAIYQVIIAGGISLQRILGFLLSIIAAILLTTRDRF